MRIKNLICSEFRFLLKYGIIALYGIFTAVYLCLIAAIPHRVKEITLLAGKAEHSYELFFLSSHSFYVIITYLLFVWQIQEKAYVKQSETINRSYM